MAQPLIGIPCCPSPEVPGRLFVNTPYVQAVIAAGGLPLLLPETAGPAAAGALMQLAGGLLLPGGEDISPRFFGQLPAPSVTTTLAGRDAFELALFAAARSADKPVFGICRGMQLINVALGGDLVQDLPTQWPGSCCHRQDLRLRSERTHPVQPQAGTLMAQLLGEGPVLVNSLHHQAVARLGEGLSIGAQAPDGVIEAVQTDDGRCFAVQWHPEELFLDNPLFLSLFSHLVQLCAR